MNERYQSLAERLRQELASLEIVVDRAERAMNAATRESSEI